MRLLCRLAPLVVALAVPGAALAESGSFWTAPGRAVEGPRIRAGASTTELRGYGERGRDGLDAWSARAKGAAESWRDRHADHPPRFGADRRDFDGRRDGYDGGARHPSAFDPYADARSRDERARERRGRDGFHPGADREAERHARRGFHPDGRAEADRFDAAEGSFREPRYRAPIGFAGGEAGAFYGTSGATGGGISVINIQGAGVPNAALDAGTATAGSAVILEREAAEPRIIDVASARLDRRPFGENGLDVVHVGSAKIIRIAPNGRADAKDEVALPELDGGFAALPPAERAVRVYPDPGEPDILEPEAVEGEIAEPEIVVPEVAVPRPAVPTPRPEPERAEVRPEPPAAAPTPPAGFEPWTADWLRDCVERYPNFDASLGTYLDEAGRRRFCTGEP